MLFEVIKTCNKQCYAKCVKICIAVLAQLKVCVIYNVLALSKFFYPPTDAQVNCLKNNFKIYIKIYIKTAPTCFGAITIIRSALFVLAKVTVVKIVN
jgi:hypothetical protein